MGELVGEIEATEFHGHPMRIFRGKYMAPSNDPEFRDGQFLGKNFAIDVEIVVHPNASKRILINIPGANGNIDGYAKKYKVLASHVQDEKLAAVVRTDNHFLAGYLPDVKLRGAIEYSLTHAWEICGNDKPEIWIMGFSAGSSAAAAIAHDYPQITKLLLMAPSGDMGLRLVEDGLKKFTGDITIVIGEEDDVVGVKAGDIFFAMTSGARHKELIKIPNCDHQFRGEVNGRIMSEAPFYAFLTENKPKFPDPRGGIKLYS